jgi:DNA-binding response OmpR family regulator
MEKRCTVMLLEDEVLIANDIRSSLMDYGFDIGVVAYDEKMAREYLDSARPDVALLDLNLGSGRNSFAIARRLKELKCPVIFVSGYSRDNYELPGELSDALWMNKPFSEQDLIAKLDSVVCRAC